jgi:RHS repeat-associated protein
MRRWNRLKLTATASDPDSGGSIQAVNFFANGTAIGTGIKSTATTWTLTWSTSALNTYSITAAATDNLGVKATSAAISIQVAGPQVVYYHNDFAGSPLAATDSTGAVLWKETYEPYGSRYLNQDATTRNGLWFTGKPTEETTGLSDFGARWYNPQVGRFYSTDPLRFTESNSFSFNRYAYGNNNPYRFIDPSGKSPFDLAFLAWDLGKLGVALYNGSGAGEALVDVGIKCRRSCHPDSWIRRGDQSRARRQGSGKGSGSRKGGGGTGSIPPSASYVPGRQGSTVAATATQGTA